MKCETEVLSFDAVIQIKRFFITDNYGVPLRSKYPNSEMLFPKQNISREVQNMMPKIIIYRSRPKNKKICSSNSSLFEEILDNEIFDGKINSKSKIFDDVTN